MDTGLTQSGEVPRARVEDLQKYLSTLPQAPGMQTEHFFSGGMYCRRHFIPAGTLVVSKVHKTEHLFVGCVGRLNVWGQGDFYILFPGGVVPSQKGTKRIVYAPEDTVVMTIHKTDVTNVDEIESELMEPDETALYDVNNQPKPGVLVYSPENIPGLEH